MEIFETENKENILRGRILRLYKVAGLEEFSSWREQCIQVIKKKYPDPANYIMYHVLVGGGAPPSCNQWDFPGDDSVEKMISDFEKEYEKEE